MAAAADVVAPQISTQGRHLLRHVHLRARQRRLEEIVRELRARHERTGDRRSASMLAGFERELDAARRELRALTDRSASPRR